MPRTPDTEKVLTCFEFLEHITQKPLVLPTCDLKLHDMSFTQMIAKYQWEFDAQVLPHLKIKLNVVQYQQNKAVILIYDNRFYKNVHEHWPEIAVILDWGQHIVKQGNFDICIPFSSKSSESNLPPEEPLPHLLGTSAHLLHPTNYKEFIHVIYKLKLQDNICVSYFWKIIKINWRFGQVWIHPAKALYKIHIEAFLKPDYTIGFRKNTNYLDALKMEKITQGRKKVNVFEHLENTVPPPANEFQKNNATSVNVKLTGLNEFYNLSCIQLQDWSQKCIALGETISVLWVELDNKNEARHVTYKDKFVFQQMELKDQKAWTRLFDLIWKQREKMMEEKKKILNSVLKYLQCCVGSEKDRFKHCLSSLETSIQNHKVLVYSSNDFVLHAIKLQFAFYMKNRKSKYFRGIALNLDAKNNVAMLKTSEMTFCNFFNYLELEQNETNECSLPPVLWHHIKTLKYHPRQANKMTTQHYVSKRGMQCANQLFSAWQLLGKMFRDNFQFDIFSLPFMSLPGLSYKAIWSCYSKKGSMYHHAIEKTKPYDQELLRQHSRGGYSFSAQLKRDANEKMNDNTEEVCKNIQSYDIKSSYGYACSEMSAIKGFCISFKATENNKLVRCDPVARFKSFEFLSVFYTLYTLETIENINIKTVYSNFSQNGIFWVGHYPLDLVVITQEGKLLLYNFDGQYCHFCKKCPGLVSYVQNKSKEELQRLTETRDEKINSWCQHLNRKMASQFFSNTFCQYQVITDCHHPLYQKKHLISTFQTTPTLFPLMSDYIEKKEIDLNDVLFCSDSLTFLALIEGHIPHADNKPLLILNSETDRWQRSNCTLNQCVLVSRDYLKWIQQEFDFKVDKIHKVWFYKKCSLFNVIFKDLITQRSLPSISPSQNQFLKNIVNMCAGFFGLNEQKKATYTNVRLVTELSQTTKVYDTEIIPAGWVENTEFLILKKHILKRNMSQIRNACLPLYCFIIEFGKMRLSQMFCFFESMLMPDKYMFVYSQIDNLTLILSTDSLEKAVKTVAKPQFNHLQAQLFGSSPGCLKKEFEFTSADGWRYVTSMPQNYAILANNATLNIHKNNGLNQISSEFSYQAAIKILNKEKLSILQNRRSDKMCNTDMITKTLYFASHV